MTVVVDASVAVKWVIPEQDTEEAQRLLAAWRDRADEIIAPPIFRAEVTNLLHQYTRRELIGRYDAWDALDALLSLVVIREPGALYSRALTLAHELSLGATYDALYVALAESERCEMWTADLRLVRSVRSRFPLVRKVTETP